MSTRQYLDALYPNWKGPGFLSLWEMPGKTSRHFDTSKDGWQDAVESQAAVWDVENRNVFCGLCLRSRDFGYSARGTKRDVIVIPGFWMDIDIGGAGHKGVKYPTDLESVVRGVLFPFTQGGGLEPTLVVHSGGGVHAYWLFDQPLPLSDVNRAQVSKDLDTWQERLIGHAKESGWMLDNTSDLARVLRPVGTNNRKTETPRPVVVLGGSGVRHTYVQIQGILTASSLAPPITPTLLSADAEAPATSDDRVSSEIIDGARDKLKRSRHADRKSIINAVLEGKPFAQMGERDRTLQKLASWIAWGDPEADPEILAEVLRPSLDAMAAESPDDYLSFEDAVKKISRAQNEASLSRQETAARDKAFAEALARGVARSQPPSETAPHTVASQTGGTVPSPSAVPFSAAVGSPGGPSFSVAVGSPGGSSFSAAVGTTALVPVKQGPLKVDSPEAHLGRPSYAPEEIASFCRAQEAISGQVIPIEVWRRRWVIQAGEYFYVYGTRGYQKAIARGALEVSLPRDLSPLPEAYFNWRKINEKGTARDKTPPEVLKELGTVAREVVVSMMTKESYYDGTAQTFYEVACPLRALEPVFDENIDRWLRLLGGEHQDKLLDWLATLTEQRRPSCAVIVTGVKDAGKSMLSLGCSRLWTTNGPTKMAEASANWNDDLQKCPLVVADEHLPENFSGKPVSTQWLRDLVASDRRPLHRKFQPNATLLGSLRIMLLANNDDMLRLGEESLGPDALAAVAGRFLHVYAGQAAADFLTGLGGRSYTEEQGWVEGDRIARHLVWLKENRQVVPGNRFMVEGQLSAMHQKLAIQGTIPNLVSEYLARYMESSAEQKSLGHAVYIEDGHLYASADGIRSTWGKFIAGDRGAPTLQNINASLANLALSKQQISTKIKEPGAKVEKNRRFWQINTDLVFQWNREKGGCDDELMEKNLKTLCTLRVLDGGKKAQVVAPKTQEKSPTDALFSVLGPKP
jgi:hypothetical protein